MNYKNLYASMNFSTLLGISAASKSDYFNETISLVGLSDDNYIYGFTDDAAGYQAAFKNGLANMNGKL